MDKHPAINIRDALCFWDFHEPAGRERVSSGQFPYKLTEHSGPINRVTEGPFGYAADLKSGQWFEIPRGEFPAIDFFGQNVNFTIVSWIKRESKSPWQTIAGVWNESRSQRQYCLFVNGTSRTDSRSMQRLPCRELVHGHLSDVGASTAGFPYCLTYGTSPTTVPIGSWTMIGMRFDRKRCSVFVNGAIDIDDGKNPFPFENEIFHGDANFTVGAVSRSNEIGNFLLGKIGGLAIYNRVLSDDELQRLHTENQQKKHCHQLTLV